MRDLANLIIRGVLFKKPVKIFVSVCLTVFATIALNGDELIIHLLNHYMRKYDEAWVNFSPIEGDMQMAYVSVGLAFSMIVIQILVEVWALKISQDQADESMPVEDYTRSENISPDRYESYDELLQYKLPVGAIMQSGQKVPQRGHWEAMGHNHTLELNAGDELVCNDVGDVVYWRLLEPLD